MSDKPNGPNNTASNTASNDPIPSLTSSPTALKLINEAMRELFATYKSLVDLQRNGHTETGQYRYIYELFHTAQAFIVAVERYNALHYGLTQEEKHANQSRTRT